MVPFRVIFLQMQSWGIVESHIEKMFQAFFTNCCKCVGYSIKKFSIFSATGINKQNSDLKFLPQAAIFIGLILNVCAV